MGIKQKSIATTEGRSFSRTYNVPVIEKGEADYVIHGNPLFYSRKIVVVGASVSSGAGASSYENSWSGRLAAAVERRGFTVHNAGVGSNKAIDIIHRFHKDVVLEDPDFAIFNLGLMNEGIQNESDFYRVYSQWLQLISMCRQHDIVPILGHCYGSSHYSPEMSSWIREMNRHFESLNVATINFYGAITDWTNHSHLIPNADGGDGTHPTDIGHAEMFYAIPPSLFEKLPNYSHQLPQREAGGLHLLNDTTTDRPLHFVPNDPVSAFTVFARFRTTSENNGFDVFGIGGSGERRISLLPNLAYVDESSDIRIQSSVTPSVDRLWHSVAVSYNPLDDIVRFYVDARLVGLAQAPNTKFTDLGIGGRAGHPECNVRHTEFQDLLVYRTRLTDDQVIDLHNGRYMKGSMELYAPLSEKVIYPDQRLINRAPTDSYVRVRTQADQLQPVSYGVTVTDVVGRSFQFPSGMLYVGGVTGSSLVFRKSDGTEVTLVE